MAIDIKKRFVSTSFSVTFSTTSASQNVPIVHSEAISALSSAMIQSGIYLTADTSTTGSGANTIGVIEYTYQFRGVIFKGKIETNLSYSTTLSGTNYFNLQFYQPVEASFDGELSDGSRHILVTSTRWTGSMSYGATSLTAIFSIGWDVWEFPYFVVLGGMGGHSINSLSANIFCAVIDNQTAQARLFDVGTEEKMWSAFGAVYWSKVGANVRTPSETYIKEFSPFLGINNTVLKKVFLLKNHSAVIRILNLVFNVDGGLFEQDWFFPVATSNMPYQEIEIGNGYTLYSLYSEYFDPGSTTRRYRTVNYIV